jgi:hypothetical protein
MLLRPANKMRAISVGLPVNMCYALNEIKANMLSQSCRCQGYSTFLLNLMLTDKNTARVANDAAEMAEVQGTWKEDYILGSSNKIVGFVFKEGHVGKKFAEAPLPPPPVTLTITSRSEND